MAQQLSFSLVNLNPAAAGKAILYKPGKEDLNQLQLTISNNGPDLSLKGGAPASENNLPAGQTGLYLSFGNLLTDGGKRMVPTAAGWAFRFIGVDNAWALSPTTDRVLAKGDKQVIGLTGFAVNTEATVGSLTVDHLNFSGIRDNSVQLHATVSEPPVVGNRDLHNTIALEWEDGYNDVFLTAELSKPLVNTNVFTLRNLSQEIIKGGPNTLFTLNFVYGAAPGFGALCTIKQASGIGLSVSAAGRDKANWGVTPTSAFAWTFSPHLQVLGIDQGASRTFTIDKLISTLQPGFTSLYLSWQDVPGFNDGSTSLLMEKKLAPVINAFTVTPNNVQVKDGAEQVKVLATWEPINAPNRVWLNGSLLKEAEVREGKQDVMVSKSNNSVKLTATFGKNHSVDKEILVEVDYVPIVGKITLTPLAFDCSTNDDLEVTVSWHVPEAESVSFFDDFVPGLQGATSSRVIKIRPSQLREWTDLAPLTGLTIRLQANGSGGRTLKKEATIYKTPLLDLSSIDAELKHYDSGFLYQPIKAIGTTFTTDEVKHLLFLDLLCIQSQMLTLKQSSTALIDTLLQAYSDLKEDNGDRILDEKYQNANTALSETDDKIQHDLWILNRNMASHNKAISNNKTLILHFQDRYDAINKIVESMKYFGKLKRIRNCLLLVINAADNAVREKSKTEAIEEIKKFIVNYKFSE